MTKVIGKGKCPFRAWDAVATGHAVETGHALSQRHTNNHK
jgi:hypothetical protein